MRGLPHAYGDALSSGGESQQLQVPPSLFDCDDPGLMQSMVSALRAQLLAVNPVGPYRIAGYSFSGLLAFELATRLELEGHRVEILVIIDSVFGSRSLGGFARTLVDRLRRRFRRSLHSHRPEQDAEKAAAGSLILNRCIREARRYRPREYAGRVLLARSNETALGGFANWRKHLRGKVIEQQFVGDHLSLILNPAQIDQVAEAIQQAMPASQIEQTPRQRHID
jgi:thioesterase domain-containing protein